MAKQLITAYSDSLLNIDELNTWLKLDSDGNEDDLVLSLVKSAISTIENICNISIFAQTWANYYNDFPLFPVIKIKMYPANVSAVSSITYYDEDNAQQTLATSVYDTDLITQPAYVTLKNDQEYPATYESVNNVVVNFTAGWASWAAIPSILKTAIKMTATHWHCNRQPVVIGRMVSEIPMTVKYLLQNSGYLIKEF